MRKTQTTKLVLILLVLILLSTSVFAFSDPQEALEAYFEADKDENIDAMIDLTDFSFITDEDEREEFINRLDNILDWQGNIYNSLRIKLKNIEIKN